MLYRCPADTERLMADVVSNTRYFYYLVYLVIIHMLDQHTKLVTFNLKFVKVKTAVQFLQNPKVSSSPLVQKQEFLKRKGLTAEEIKTAFKLASVGDTVADRNAIQNQNPYTAVQMPLGSIPPYLQRSVYQPTLLYKIKEFFNVTALIGATVFCVYWFYKVFSQRTEKLKDLYFVRAKHFKSV